MSKSWYRYTVSKEIEYDLGCEFLISATRPHVLGCDLYNMQGEYVGYWNRSDMPVWLVRKLEKWLLGDASMAGVMTRRKRFQ